MQCKRAVGPTWGMEPSTCRWLYYTVIRPILSYCSSIWVLQACRCLLQIRTESIKPGQECFSSHQHRWTWSTFHRMRNVGKGTHHSYELSHQGSFDEVFFLESRVLDQQASHMLDQCIVPCPITSSSTTGVLRVRCSIFMSEYTI